jgi:hypothetical protein
MYLIKDGSREELLAAGATLNQELGEYGAYVSPGSAQVCTAHCIRSYSLQLVGL